ncbi:DUF1648 domain-containing protein [Streptosporangium sp. NBC_01755]|uniref:DUF1648 domain-containing protein n=1 Tax=Streptosporangium sp. NBC_01755 TaxID=2975949 RepID=UPI002DDC6F21|nr:DUF1648 domain-containing protein [Streptosporangium sp. NBC_01755]WSC98853.1 DUF1648 domain-containing protein [Streptosporangium sp. NBC_01755]
MTAGWAALVAATLIAVPLALRDRLPDPIATHWGPSGAPDGSMPFTVSLLFQAGLWTLIAGASCASALVNAGMLRRRASRMALGALLGGGGMFFLGLQAITLSANLDAPGWWQAGHLGWGALLVPALLVLGGWLGALLGRPGPDDLPERGAISTRKVPLRPGQRAVWVSSARNNLLVTLGGSVLAAGVGLTVLALLGGDGTLWIPAAIMLLVGLVGVTFSSVRVQVTEEGVVLFYGPLRLPRKHIPITQVERAWSEELFPSNVGGWGIRGLPGAVTVMLRGGECLVVGYVSGGRFAVSIDDAENGAALLNTLVARVSTGPGAR